jgi:hypothetical protein
MPRLNNRVRTSLPRPYNPHVLAALWSFLAALSLGVITGCNDKPEVREYVIPGKMPEALLTRDRLLGAIIPQEKEVWFVKVLGPAEAVKFADKQIRDFAKSLTFTPDGPDLTKLPAGWNRGGKKQMRFATLLVDTPEAQLDVSISQLPYGGEWEEQVVSNVNRWRGQLKFPPSTDKAAGAELLDVVSATDKPAYWVDLTGELGAGTTAPPMMAPSMAGGNPPFAEMASQAPVAEAGTEEPSASTAPDPSTGLQYKAPEGWRPGKMSMMRLAAFNIGPEDQQAELTIITAGGDLRGNVARWLGQVRGDTPPGEVVSKALEAAEDLKVSGRDAKRYYLRADGESQASDAKPPEAQAIDATIIPIGDGMSMFIKATGPPETLESEKERIGEFISSLQLP